MRKCALFALVLLIAAAANSQTAPDTQPTNEKFTKQDVMIPMRDGARLQTVIFSPKDAKSPLPILLMRTPYGVPDNERRVLNPTLEDFNRDGYIWVVQNLRGRFKSEGKWEMQRSLCAVKTNCVDESTDAYDTIDWLVKNVANNNGRVGIWGISYPGWTTTMALINPHPALKAASEQASPADMFLGDDFHHNGAFRLSYGFEYGAAMETDLTELKFYDFHDYDTYDWFLRLGSVANVNAKYFHNKIPAWNDFIEHPNRDDYWYKQSFDSSLKSTTVPNLNVAGWWDQEDFYGPQHIYGILEKTDTNHLNYIVAGPWNHGGWMGNGEHLGPVHFGSDTAKEFRADIMAPWFRYWLHNEGKLTEPEAKMFETGTNQWKSYDSWPPKEAVMKKLYFHSSRKLSFDAPTDTAAAFDNYISDPANPVPYRPRPITATYPGPEWPVWLVQDQRFVDHRPDVLSWETDPLTDDVVIAGEITADLFAATTGGDADWIVKLIDVYPDDYKAPEDAAAKDSGQDEDKADKGPKITGGYQLIIADEVFRGRFRKSFSQPSPISSNQVEEYKFSLHSNDHAFLKGHRIMVQVQSAWFPLIDRNPQKYVPSIYEAKDSDFIKATQSIYRTKTQASGVIVPVLNAK